MDSKSLNHFNRFIAAEYSNLSHCLTDKDSLHDAYIIVSDLPQIIPADYLPELSRAYHLSRRRYLQHIFQFIVPDPRFWLYQCEEWNADCSSDNMIEQEQIKQQQEKQNHMKAINFLQWLRQHSTKAEYIIFRMYYYEHLDISDIARITGKTKHQVLELIDRKCKDYRAAHDRKLSPVDMSKSRNNNKLNTSTSQYTNISKDNKTTATAPAICFRISRQGHYCIIPTRKCIEYLGMKVGNRLFIPQYDNRFFLYVLPNDAAIYSCTLRRGTRPYNLLSQAREVVQEILKATGATTSVTLPIKPTGNQNYWLIDINNPIKIN